MLYVSDDGSNSIRTKMRSLNHKQPSICVNTVGCRYNMVGPIYFDILYDSGEIGAEYKSEFD